MNKEKTLWEICEFLQSDANIIKTTLWEMFSTILSLKKLFSLGFENWYSIPHTKFSGNFDDSKLFSEF